MNLSSLTHKPAWNRRTVLKGAGACIALPFMESLLPRSSQAVEAVSATPRLAVVTVPFGMVQERFHPASDGRRFDLPATLQPLAEHRDRFTVFSHFDHGVRGGHAANHAMLSGILSTERAAFPDGNISVDQRAAELIGHNTRFPSLVFWEDGMSFTRSGVRVPAIEKPSDAFRMMFVNDSEEKKAFNRASLDSSGSILDAVRSDAKRLKPQLGHEDQQKLEEYFTSIRETERKLELAEQWIDRPKPATNGAALKKIADGTRDENSGGNLVGVWLDLMFLALQTDSTRVVSMSVNNCNWGLDGVSEGYHTLSHHGQRKDRLDQLAIVESFLMRNFADFLGRLQNTRQPDDSSLLDATQVLFGSGLGSGSRHSNDNLPLLLAGGGFQHGQHLNGQRKQPLCNLFLSMLQRMGAEQDVFNRSRGTLTGLS